MNKVTMEDDQEAYENPYKTKDKRGRPSLKPQISSMEEVKTQADHVEF